ncbi:MAG: C4-type zinc ribbon domain-containing protein [Chloroflexi bacterium]|nr:C4-type zinc ribbon domain-containing protein [Chloroflexota bacterium]
MTVVQQLYDLLAVDVEIDKHKQSIASIDETLADNRLLLGTQRAVEETQATLREQETVRKDLELIVESYQDKGKQLETKLYGGTVRNPRELRDMQVELNLLQEHQKQQEESLLLSLEGVEDTERRLGNLQSALEEIQTARQKQQEQLLGEKTNLEKDSGVLNEKRQGLSSLVSPEHLRLYDSLRSIRQGQAVAKVDRGMCQGCRISLPTKIVQSARTSEKPVQCPSCSRILYAG